MKAILIVCLGLMMFTQPNAHAMGEAHANDKDCVNCGGKLSGTEQPALEANSRSIAQVEEAVDPNKGLGLDPVTVKLLCMVAQKKVLKTFRNIQNFSNFEEIMFSISNKKTVLLEAHKAKAEIDIAHKEEIAELWDEKYNKIFCPVGSSFTPEGYIDVMLLLTEQTDAFEALYNPNGDYKADINHIVKLDPYSSDEKAQWMTVADLIKYYIEHPIGQMTERRSLVEKFQLYYDLITKHWGAKHYSELVKENILQAKRAK